MNLLPWHAVTHGTPINFIDFCPFALSFPLFIMAVSLASALHGGLMFLPFLWICWQTAVDFSFCSNSLEVSENRERGRDRTRERNRDRTRVFSRQRERERHWLVRHGEHRSRPGPCHLLSAPLNLQLYRRELLCCFNWVYWSKRNVHMKAKTAYSMTCSPYQKQTKKTIIFNCLPGVKLYCSEVAFSQFRRLNVVPFCFESK